jgi:RHS repeat-associated protein
MKSNGAWNRHYFYNGNKLLGTDNTTTQPANQFSYDAHGNMLKMPHLPTMDWDFMDNLKQVDLGGGGTAHYVYDGSGNRVRKVIVNGSSKKERLYVGEFEIYRDYTSNVLQTERETVNISDDQKRFLQIETLTIDSGTPIVTPTAVFRYQYDNHLGSACLELDSSAQIITYEEYHPFGTSSYRSGKSGAEASLKRYRYSGKERDDETGLYYYGARYCASWLGRFVSVDPLAENAPDKTPYHFVSNNPINRIDTDGLTDYEINSKGEVVNIIKNKDVDNFYMVDDGGNRIKDQSITLDFGTIESTRSQSGTYQKRNDDGTISKEVTTIDIFKVRGDENGTKLFEFFSDNTTVEWSQAKTGIQGDKGLNFLTTGHIEYTEPGMSALINGQLYGGYTLREFNHNHPGGTTVPSGIPGLTGNNGDVSFAKAVTEWYEKAYPNRSGSPTYNIYVKDKPYIPYSKDSKKSDYGY